MHSGEEVSEACPVDGHSFSLVKAPRRIKEWRKQASPSSVIYFFSLPQTIVTVKLITGHISQFYLHIPHLLLAAREVARCIGG